MGMPTMSQDLERAGDLLVPITGELVDIGDPNEVCRALDEVRDLKRQLDRARVVLEDALRLESERQGTKTLHLAGYTAVVSGGTKTEYDIEELADELLDLGLPASRVAELVVATVTYRVSKTVAKQVAGANPRYAEAIDRHSRQVPDYWRVKVDRA